MACTILVQLKNKSDNEEAFVGIRVYKIHILYKYLLRVVACKYYWTKMVDLVCTFDGEREGIDSDVNMDLNKIRINENLTSWCIFCYLDLFQLFRS